MANQVITVPDISVVKTVNGTKQLFSLRNQKVKKGNALYDFKAGSGVKYNGDLYVLAPYSLIDILNKFVSDNNYYSMIGKNYNNDGRIVFSYQDSTFNLNNVGIVNEDGTIWTFHVIDNGYRNADYSDRCLSPFLVGDYVFYRNGQGTYNQNYLAIINIKTNEIVWSNSGSFKYLCGLVYGMINSNGLVEFYDSVSDIYRPMLNITELASGDFIYERRDDKAITIDGKTFSSNIIPLYKLDDGYYRCIVYNSSTYREYCVADIADIKYPNSSEHRLVKSLQSNCEPYYNYQCNIVSEKYLFSMYDFNTQRLNFYDRNMNIVGYSPFSSSDPIGNYSMFVLNDTLYTNTKTLGAKWNARPTITVA